MALSPHNWDGPVTTRTRGHQDARLPTGAGFRGTRMARVRAGLAQQLPQRERRFCRLSPSPSLRPGTHSADTTNSELTQS